MFLAFWGCSEQEEMPTDFTDECERIEGPQEVLEALEDSRKFIPYPDSIRAIVFSDSQGREYVGEVFHNSYTKTTTLGKKKCPLDKDLLVAYWWETLNHRFAISFKELNLDVWIRVFPDWEFHPQNASDIVVSDYCQASLSSTNQDTANLPIGSIIIDANPRGYTEPRMLYSELKDSVTIHGTTFKNVYVSHANDHNWLSYDMYYNKSLGLIAFRDSNNPKLFLKFERIE